MHKRPKLGSKFVMGIAVKYFKHGYFKKKVKLTGSDVLSKLQPPYIVLANHAGFADVAGVATLMYPTCGNFVTSETQMAGKGFILKKLGVITKKQFVVEPSLIRDIKYVLSKNRPVIIFPEGKFSVDGTANEIKPSIAKLVKMMKVPVVTVCFKGNYVNKPARWAKDQRVCPMHYDVKLAVSSEEVGLLSVEEIHNRIKTNLTYDDYKWQRENKIEIKSPTLCEGLEGILYKCPCCGTEFAMTSHGNTLTCDSCGSTVTQDEYGVLDGKFTSVSEWYNWQRECVDKELPDFNYSAVFKVEKMNDKFKYFDVGEGTLTVSGEGITLELASERLFFKRGQFFTLSFNNDYLFLPTEKNVYRLHYTKDKGINAKLNLVIEQQSRNDG